MTKRVTQKHWLIGIAAIAVVFMAAYIVTLGHIFLPFRDFNHHNEKIEIRVYSAFVIPSSSDTMRDALHRLGWRIQYPGRAGFLAAAEKLQTSAPNQSHELQEVFEALGYPFPPGCYASSGDIVSGWRISNYPSVLDRIERDLNLKPEHTLRLPETSP